MDIKIPVCYRINYELLRFTTLELTVYVITSLDSCLPHLNYPIH